DAWWINAYRNNRYEYLYQKNKISELDTVHTPVTLEGNGLYISLHEANLTDFSSMTIYKADSIKLACDLIPWSDGIKVKTNVPFVTPWRTIQIADKPGDLVTSYLILNLNEPNKIEDVSWITPMKYVGIWWGMHIGVYSWSSGNIHGATTENAKIYIDFAAKHGIKGVLIEGWNLGWDGEWWKGGEDFDFTTPYPDFDIKEITDYAASKGVEIIGHHETGANTINYEAQIEDAFEFYNKYSVDGIKTGYVGEWLDKKEWHHGQYGVQHYRKVVELAAKHKIMLDVHEPIKATGIRRTYPNMMSREGARGQEYNAWSDGNGCEHTTVIPFTRCLAGPFDYTPGVLDINIKYREGAKVPTTLVKQLALYVTIYSPLHMACDLPENYEGQPAFKFIEDVPVDWEETKVLNAKIGDYITTVRKDRNSSDWYLGSITDEEAREFIIKLDFLDPGLKYEAQIYADGADADWNTNPTSIDIQTMEVTSASEYTIKLAAGGGQAIRFKALE
ncbi:glycoside hydrolase family 97 catalytic domain-containing protein, partial [Bacteroidota bacterium]